MNANPYLIQGPALISFSGGRTSGFMLKHILDAHGGTLPADVHVAFANTGDEREETLEFVRDCSAHWGVPITWVEFDPYVEDSTRVVTFEDASRSGEPLDAAIATRPTAHLYNVVSRYCTATTKLRRLQKLMLKGHGYERWTSVLGLRHDEPKRVASNRARSGRDRQTIALPLDDAGVTNPDVLTWWVEQPFQLRLPVINGETLHGNCESCCLKHWTKLVRIFREDPSKADRMISREDRMRLRLHNQPYTGTGQDRRASFFKDGKSYRDLVAYALSDKPIPKIRGAGSVDCACTD